MLIYFMKNTENKLKINKTFDASFNKDAILKNATNIKNPEFILNYDSRLLNVNYVFIPDFDRYYYINEITIVNHTMNISMVEDVLMSLKNDIMVSTVHATRSSKGNKYINDEMSVVAENTNWQSKRLASPFTEGDFYVITIGGKD